VSIAPSAVRRCAARRSDGPSRGHRATPVGHRLCGGGGGTRFPAPCAPRHGNVVSTCARARSRLWNRPACPLSMRRRARHRLEGQGIARTCLEMPSARSRPRLTFRRRHTPSPPHGDPPFRNLIKATSPLDALRDSSLEAATRARRTSSLSARGRCNSHLCIGSCFIGVVRATGMGHITKAPRYSAVSRVCQHEPSPRSPSAGDDVHHHRNCPGQISIRSGPSFRKVAPHQDYM